MPSRSPVVRAVAGRLSGRLGLIHFDAHYDLAWDPKYDDRVGTGSHPAARLFVEVMAAMAWRRSA